VLALAAGGVGKAAVAESKRKFAIGSSSSDTVASRATGSPT
jgi:hypothetical protein